MNVDSAIPLNRKSHWIKSYPKPINLKRWGWKRKGPRCKNSESSTQIMKLPLPI